MARIQPIHLYLGDQYAAGMRPTAEAAPYNVDSAYPLMSYISGGTNAGKYVYPSPIIANEWSLEHILGAMLTPAVTSFAKWETPAQIKVALDDVYPDESFLVDRIDVCMERVLTEPLFCFPTPGAREPSDPGDRICRINGQLVLTGGTPATVVPAGARVRGVLESTGFTIKITPTYAFGAARASAILQLDANNKLEIPLSGGQNTVRVTAGGSSNSTPGFSTAALTPLWISVDWVRALVTVFHGTTQAELASADLTHGDWSGLEAVDITFGVHDGDIEAPRPLPEFAAPQLDLIVVQAAAGLGIGASAAAEASLWVELVRHLRGQSWGAMAPVWFILPGELVPCASILRARAALLAAADQLPDSFVVETRHLARTTSGGLEVLTGESLRTLAATLARDWQGIVDARRRFTGRPRFTGYRRFENGADADAFIAELLEAGVTTRETNPMLGGSGVRVGDGIQVPWVYARTAREAGDHVLDPNTGETLVSIDQDAARAGFTAPARGIKIVPSTAGDDAPDPIVFALPGAPLMTFDDLVSGRAAQGAFQSLVRQVFEGADGDRALVDSQLDGMASAWTVTGDASATPTPGVPFDNVDGGFVMAQTNTGASKIRTTAAVAAVSVADALWIGAWVKVDPAAVEECVVYAAEGAGAVGVAGVVLDPITGESFTVGTAQTHFVLRRGEWFLVVFRYPAGDTIVYVQIVPTATLSVGQINTFEAIARNATTLSERAANHTPYAYNLQPRVLASGNVLTEGARENVLTENVSLAPTLGAWTDEGVTAARGETGPDGSVNSWILQQIGVDDPGSLRYAFADLVLAGGDYSVSVFVKLNELAVFCASMRFRQGASLENIAEVAIDVASGDVALMTETGFSGTVVSSELIEGPDGSLWARATMVVFSVSTALATVDLFPSSNFPLGTPNHESTDPVEFFGPQMEIGTFASSMIRSMGSAATRTQDELTFTSGEIDASFYTDGFALDVWPAHASGQNLGHHYIISFAAAATYYLRLTAGAGSTDTPTMRNGGAARTNGTITYAAGDKVTFVVVHGATCAVYVNDVLALTIDISADTDWSAVTGNTAQLGTDAAGGDFYGEVSPIRAS